MAAATVADVATFMATGLHAMNYLYQQQIAWETQQTFGDEFVYFNKNMNLAIRPEVLAAFRKLTPDVVWVRGQRLWRKRAEYDEIGKREVD